MKREIKTPWGFTYERETVSWEEGLSLIETYKGQELIQYSALYNVCSEIKPYLLNDGRVVVMFADATIVNSLKGYIAGLQTSQMFTRKKISTTYPQKRIEYLPGGGKVYYYLLDKTEGEVIRNLYTPLDKSVYPCSRGMELYRTLENEILEYPGSYYRLYISEADYRLYHDKKRALLAELTTTGKPMHLVVKKDRGYININMCGRNPYGEKFPEKVDGLCAKLPDLLHMSNSIFTCKESSLKKIGRVFYRNIITDEFSDKLFLPMLAYLGKTFLSNHKGAWEMRYDKTFDSWTPDIRVEEGLKEMYWPLLEVFDSTERMWSPLQVVLRNPPKAR